MSLFTRVARACNSTEMQLQRMRATCWTIFTPPICILHTARSLLNWIESENKMFQPRHHIKCTRHVVILHFYKQSAQQCHSFGVAYTTVRYKSEIGSARRLFTNALTAAYIVQWDISLCENRRNLHRSFFNICTCALCV
jgi:hypothetical protein